MIKKRGIWGLLFYLLLGSITFGYWFFEDEPVPMFFHFDSYNLYDGHFLLEMADKIELTPAQTEKIKKMMIECQEYYIRNSAEIKIRELRLAALIKEEKIDRQLVKKNIVEISQMKTDSYIFYVNYLLDFRQLLSEKQKKVLYEWAEKTKKEREAKDRHDEKK